VLTTLSRLITLVLILCFARSLGAAPCAQSGPDEAITEQVHNQGPYNSKGRRTTTNDADSIFRRGGKQLMPALTKDSQGYTAKFEIGVQIS
jgi:hypothetical protein